MRRRHAPSKALDRSGGVDRAFVKSFAVVTIFITVALLGGSRFHAQGADSLQYLDILKIFQGQYHKVTSLDSLPVGVLNRTPLYPTFLWAASIFAGNNAAWLTVIANGLCTLCTLPLILRVFGKKFGHSSALAAYIILASMIFPYFMAISAEWLCMHLLVVIGVIFLDTGALFSRGAGLRIGVCCACLALCRPIEIIFTVLALFVIVAHRNTRELIGMLIASTPLLLQVVLQSYIAGFLTLSQISIISDYLLCSQLGEVSIIKSDSPVLQAFITNANALNVRFDGNVLIESVSLIGVKEQSSLYSEGVRNQDRTLEFKQHWNLSYGELNRLIKEYNSRARNGNPWRHIQYLISLWPLGVGLFALIAAGTLFRHVGAPDNMTLSLIRFYLCSIVVVVGYSAYFSLPVTRYVLVQAFPLFYVYLVYLLHRVFNE